jgi:hypothetical protein
MIYKLGGGSSSSGGGSFNPRALPGWELQTGAFNFGSGFPTGGPGDAFYNIATATLYVNVDGEWEERLGQSSSSPVVEDQFVPAGTVYVQLSGSTVVAWWISTARTVEDGDLVVYNDSLEDWQIADPERAVGAYVDVRLAGFSGGGGGGGGAVRADTQGGFSYLGVAVAGAAESSPVWTITRISTSSPVVVAVAADVAWDDRLTEVYS